MLPVAETAIFKMTGFSLQTALCVGGNISSVRWLGQEEKEQQNSALLCVFIIGALDRV